MAIAGIKNTAMPHITVTTAPKPIRIKKKQTRVASNAPIIVDALGHFGGAQYILVSIYLS
jgi:hypothetical protein